MLSLIIPFQNNAYTIPLLLSSITQQGNIELQLIFVNDHSSDNSLEIIKEFIDKCPYKYHIFSLTNETGQGYAILRAMELVIGTYMMVISPLEALIPNALQVFINTIESKEVNNVACYANQSLQQNYPVPKQRGTVIGTNITKIEDLFTESFTCSPCLYKVKVLQELSEWPVAYMSEGKYFSELLVLARLMKKGNIAFIPESLSIHLQADIKNQILQDYAPVKKLLMTKITKEST